MKDFADRLARLRGTKCEAINGVEQEEPPRDTVYSVRTSIRFADGTKLDAQFWRLLRAGHPVVSIFDHRQRYGLPAPIDAMAVVRAELEGKRVADASMEPTGDLHFHFEGDVVLEVFNFTGFEIWEVTFPDGTGELSNYALER